ncbi:MAG TPA: S-layer homology domain-containing protein [Acidimicrobiales bacterium]|nr:S-layer homology domain-containing protein [Acidimicrobiales bacterium]
MVAATLLVALLPVLTPAAAGAETAGAPDAYDSVIDITFPTVPEKVRFGDDFDAPRSRGAHGATDLMGPKLTPIFAARGGTVVRMGDGGHTLSGYYLTIAGDDGRSYSYIHLNNDTPGTDDGAAPPEQAYAPGIGLGAEVERGQHIGWMGDSGNAENAGSHLHFSISDPAITDPDGTDRRNPYPSLVDALDRGDVSTATVHPLGSAPPPPPAPATGPIPDSSALCGGTVTTQSFTDVTTANVHLGPIECLAARDVALGFTDGRYGPGDTVTRLQMASFVARLLEAGGVTLPEPSTDHFDDDAGSPHERAVNQLVELRIIRMDTGEVGRTFYGSIDMKRDRMAAWMTRAYELVAGQALASTSTDFFRDDDRFHEGDINRLAAAGIVQGTSPGTYEPRTSVRRDQMASYLVRTLAAAAAVR